MDAWMMLGEMLRPWVVPVGSALAGAVTGGVVARVVSSGEARRVRRERYGQNILAALGSAGIAARRAQDQAENEDYLHETGQAPEGPEDISEPLMLPSEAREIWVNTQLAASIERGHTASRAMNGWAFHMHESLLAGMRKAPELERLREQLRLGEYLVVAWLEGNATGVDFKRSEDDVYARFAPQYTDGDLPEYRPFLPGV